MTPAARARARKGEGELLRAEILDAAMQVLAETGSEHAMSIRAVADKAGVTAPSIYMHFADKTTGLRGVRTPLRVARRACRSSARGFTDRRAARRARPRISSSAAHAEQYRVLFMGTEAPETFTHPKMSEMAASSPLYNVRQCMAPSPSHRAPELVRRAVALVTA